MTKEYDELVGMVANTLKQERHKFSTDINTAKAAIHALLSTLPEMDDCDPVGNQLKRAQWVKELEKSVKEQ